MQIGKYERLFGKMCWLQDYIEILVVLMCSVTDTANGLASSRNESSFLE